MPQIVLIRHGEPALQGVILGAADVTLSRHGRRQARELAPRLAATVTPRALYSSPLRRALETSAYLLDPWRSFAVLRGLREISYGSWDGLSWRRIHASDPDLADRKLADWLSVNVPGGESWQEFEERIDAAFNLILSGPLPAVIVAHEAVNARIARHLDGSAEVEFHQDYCEMLSYALHDDR